MNIMQKLRNISANITNTIFSNKPSEEYDYKKYRLASTYDNPLDLIGAHVYDFITKQQGEVVAVAYVLYNVPRLAMKYKVNGENKYTDHDITHVVVIEESVIPSCEIVELHKDTPNLGNAVEDKINGIKGVIVKISYQISGCVYAEVEAKVDKENKAVSDFVPIQRLKFVKKSGLEDSIIEYTPQYYEEMKAEKRSVKSGCLPSSSLMPR